jgi:hypothetical protein
MIEWNPVDVLTCLETEPEVDEEVTSYRYAVDRDGVILTLEIWPYDCDVWLAIRLADQQEPVIDFRMKGCRAIRFRDMPESLRDLPFDWNAVKRSPTVYTVRFGEQWLSFHTMPSNFEPENLAESIFNRTGR